MSHRRHIRDVVPADVTVAEVGAFLRDRTDAYIVATHRNPDGDAIGSMVAVARMLAAAGREVVMWHPDVPAVPEDFAFMIHPDETIAQTLPDDAADRVMIVVDCATAGRLSDHPPAELAGTILNIDHHHDNGRFGDLNLIEGHVSSTAELLVGVFDAAGWSISRDAAEPLHVGIVTDTGRLSYSNVTPDTLRVDAMLVATGLDVAAIAHRLYENMPLAQARLLGMALGRIQALLDGRLIVSVLREEDFAAAGSDDADGIAEMLRGIRGAEVGALVRPISAGLRASLRAASDRVDVSAIARAEGGGGHRAAAGLTSHRSEEEFVAWLSEAVAAQLA